MVSITLCMIVKNEEKILGRCLSCLYDLMDEIIIVDTGSADRTKEIAAEYTDKIFDFHWVDDFAAARNFAFSKASGDYIYSADADEVLDETNRRRFRLLKENLLPDIEIVQMYYCNQRKFASVYNYDREYRPKLFKRIRTFTWVDPIHETIRTEPLVFDSEVEIIHEQEEGHAGRDLAAFERICEKGGRLSGRLLDLYARELFIAGDAGDFLRAEPYFEQMGQEEERTEGEWKEAFCVAAKAARLRGDIPKFYKYAMKAVACGSCAEICLELAYFYEEAGDDDEAAVWFYNAAFETESILDIRCGGEKALIGLAGCYRRRGFEEEAREYERMAVAGRAPDRGQGTKPHSM